MANTDTITPEERAAWRKRVDGLRKELRSAYADGNNRVDALTEENARLLTALEAAEARAEKAEDYAEKLVYAVTDGNLSNSYDVQVVADEVSRIWQSYTNQKVAAVRAEAEAERDRLRAERDWLAGSMAEDGCPYLAFWADLDEDMRPDWCICTDTADDGFDCTGDPKECWQQEAARRAVAESEVRE